MSAGDLSRASPRSTHSAHARSVSSRTDHSRSHTARTADAPSAPIEHLTPCAATAAYFLYAEENLIFIRGHESSRIGEQDQSNGQAEQDEHAGLHPPFDLHKSAVCWISIDSVHHTSPGRIAVSCDKDHVILVWDIETRDPIAQLSGQDISGPPTFRRDGHIIFARKDGWIESLDPNPHRPTISSLFNAGEALINSWSGIGSERLLTIPLVTAIASTADGEMLAIGFRSGHMMVYMESGPCTTVNPSTKVDPSPVVNLSWYGSKSASRLVLLASQTEAGVLRAWNVRKKADTEEGDSRASNQDATAVITVTSRSLKLPLDIVRRESPGPCWFAWSKNGRLLEHSYGKTHAWDLQPSAATYQKLPVDSTVMGITNHGPSGRLFILRPDRKHCAYRLKTRKDGSASSLVPELIMSETTKTEKTEKMDKTGMTDQEKRMEQYYHSMDAMESEKRDQLGRLSPTARSVSSRGSARSSQRAPKYRYDQPASSAASSVSGRENTGVNGKQHHWGRETMTSVSSMRSQPTSLQPTPQSSAPSTFEQPDDTTHVDLFTTTKSRMQQLEPRTPYFGNSARTPEMLQREMLSTVFGWSRDIRALIRDELRSHPSTSAAAFLLSKWLGEGVENMAPTIAPRRMRSVDWMAMCINRIDQDPRKNADEIDVQRLLGKGEIHPAVAILLCLGETNEALEVYISHGYWMEALLLACLVFPSDWDRASSLLQQWGKLAVQEGEADLAIRCFHYTGVQSIEFSATAQFQDATYAAQDGYSLSLVNPPKAPSISSPLTAPGRSGSNRVKHAQLKLITSFGDGGTPIDGVDERTARAMNTAGVTPMVQSALPGPTSPGGWDRYRSRSSRGIREPSSAHPALPGAADTRHRIPSRNGIDPSRVEPDSLPTPLTSTRGPRSVRAASRASKGRRAHSVDVDATPMTALKPARFPVEKASLHPSSDEDMHLPSPAKGVFTRLREESRSRVMRDRNHSNLAVRVGEQSDSRSESITTGGGASPPMTSTSSKMGRIPDDRISSVGEARIAARQDRTESRRRGESRKRTESRNGRVSSRVRDSSRARSTTKASAIEPAKRSPTSPVSMSQADIARANRSQRPEPATTDDESFYKVGVTSPVESHRSARSFRSESRQRRRRPSEDRIALGEVLAAPRSSSRAAGSRKQVPEPLLLTSDSGRGRSEQRAEGSMERSPSSPLPVLSDRRFGDDTKNEIPITIGERVRMRSQSANRQNSNLQARRAASRDRRERSSSRRPAPRGEAPFAASDNRSSTEEEQRRPSLTPEISSGVLRPRDLSKRELAAKELEERRKSLARRPSAPQIPLPGELQTPGLRPGLGPRAHTELSDSPTSFMPVLRPQTVDPEQMSRGASKPVTIPMGLPATPRAMRLNRHADSESSQHESMPPVPIIPGKFSDVSYSGSSSGPLTGSDASQSTAPTSVEQLGSNSADSIGPLLPSTVYVPAPSIRSASAPPEKNTPVYAGHKPIPPSTIRRSSAGRGPVRNISPPEASSPVDNQIEHISSIDAALHSGHEQIIIVPDQPGDPNAPPVVLPELRHLADPPPPPPPPPPTLVQLPHHNSNGSNIKHLSANEEYPKPSDVAITPIYPQPMERAQTMSPSNHRRNGGSVSESFSSRIRGFGLRSSSKSRAKSPPIEPVHSPYETVVAGSQRTRRESSVTRAQSPYETVVANPLRPRRESNATTQLQSPHEPSGNDWRPPTTGPNPDVWLNETTIPPSSLPTSRSASAMGGYRNPKEIRANMPPETLQQGVYQWPGQGGYL